MMTIVEKMARAICEASFQSWPDDSYNGRDQQRFYRNQALAALRALREPSEGMMKAMCELDCTRAVCHARLSCRFIEKTGALQAERLQLAIDAAIHEAETA